MRRKTDSTKGTSLFLKLPKELLILIIAPNMTLMMQTLSKELKKHFNGLPAKLQIDIGECRLARILERCRPLHICLTNFTRPLSSFQRLSFNTQLPTMQSVHSLELSKGDLAENLFSISSLSNLKSVVNFKCVNDFPDPSEANLRSDIGSQHHTLTAISKLVEGFEKLEKLHLQGFFILNEKIGFLFYNRILSKTNLSKLSLLCNSNCESLLPQIPPLFATSRNTTFSNIVALEFAECGVIWNPYNFQEMLGCCIQLQSLCISGLVVWDDSGSQALTDSITIHSNLRSLVLSQLSVGYLHLCNIISAIKEQGIIELFGLIRSYLFRDHHQLICDEIGCKSCVRKVFLTAWTTNPVLPNLPYEDSKDYAKPFEIELIPSDMEVKSMIPDCIPS